MDKFDSNDDIEPPKIDNSSMMGTDEAEPL